MNKFLKIFIPLYLITLFPSCNQDIDGFDNGKNYIYFNMPFVKDQFGRNTEKRVDSLSYSFALDDPALVTQYTFKIPINTVGLPNENDRKYKIEVVVDSTSAPDSEWNKTILEDLTIKSGNMRDTLYVTIQRTQALQTEWHSITFKMLANEEFQLGDKELLTAKVSYSDILTAPTWWNKWIKALGPFYREVFVKWQEIYYLGADPNVETIGGPGMGKPLYWDNMPNYANSGWYPSTYMFIRTLKQYFIDNEVYPNGDKTKPRILLP